MDQSKFRSVLRRVALLSLAAALCTSLAACKSGSPADASPAASSPAQSAITVQPVTAPLDEILETLARAGLEDYDSFSAPELDTVLSHTCDSRTLLVVRQTGGFHAAGLENLLIGLWDDTTQSLVGDVTALRGDTALHAYWEDEDKNLHILLSNTGFGMGYETGSVLNYFLFDGTQLTQVTQLPEGAFYKGEPLPDGWQTALLSADTDYWNDLKSVPYPGGTDLYTRNPAYSPNAAAETQPRQWLYLGYLALDGLELPLK